jgi:predicted nucleotidyltransferase
VKPLLYVYRVLLTGIRLMRTGELNANLLECNQEMKLPYLEDLVARKTGGPEKGALDDADFAFHEAEVNRLHALLEASAAESPLPEGPSAQGALNDLLLRIRLGAGR